MSEKGSNTRNGGDSIFLEGSIDEGSRFIQLLDDSMVVELARRAVGSGHRLTTYVRNAWLYQWLTAEPEPEVIVIDLRKTWTVGPFIRMLDSLLDTLVSWSGSSSFGSGIQWSIGKLRAAPLRVGGFIIATLAAGLLLGFFALDMVTTPRGIVLGAFLIIGVVGTRFQQSWSELQETRVVQLLVAAFEPPEPPDSTD